MFGYFFGSTRETGASSPAATITPDDVLSELNTLHTEVKKAGKEEQEVRDLAWEVIQAKNEQIGKVTEENSRLKSELERCIEADKNNEPCHVRKFW